MGFAGQVFAARVAVGLAMPSPKAFSQAGSTIGGFASKMYSSLNKKSMGAAKKQLASAEQNLAKARSGLASHSKQQDAALTNAAKGSVDRLNKAYGKLGSSAMKSASAVKGVSGAIKAGSVKTKLFKNVSKDMKDAKDYRQMMENFIKLTKTERKEVFEGFQARKIATEGRIKAAEALGESGKKQLKLEKETMELLLLQEKEFKHFDSVRNTSDDDYYDDKKEHLKKIEKATEKVDEAQKELEESEKSQIQVQKQLIASANSMAVEIKTNFVEAIRESVSVLTAFYYKLNENTQELIEFEKELLNANSVFRVTNEELFSVGDTVIQFGQQFGLEMQNGATGLYQLASAGLSAADAMTVLNDTLKLSMAVQGDHNTISKLVTQTLFGFEMEMSEATIVTDKFAYAIQKSLIEYQDLASAVKFALPFFTTTGQSIDQLLGALQILTNRALEAGIAGRGLRQGLAELAESVGDNTARFREFGVEVTDAQGNMLKLTEIAANFHNVLDAGIINDTELLTTLIEDLNVRGATAFVHLVQASDEFTAAVEATKNAGGELDEMIKIQNQSISSQIQILKNNVAMMFLYNDATFKGTAYLNAFHKAVVETVQDMRNLLVVQLANGTYQLTEFGLAIQTLGIKGIKELRKLFQDIIPIMRDFVSLTKTGFELFKIYMIPIKIIVKALDMLGPTMTKLILSFHLLAKILPIAAASQMFMTVATLASKNATWKDVQAKIAAGTATNTYISSATLYLGVQSLITAMTWKNIKAQIYSIYLRITSIKLVGTTYKFSLKSLALSIKKHTWDTAINYQRQKSIHLRIKDYALALKDSIIKRINLAITKRQILLGNVENLHLTNKNSLKVFELATTKSLIKAYVIEMGIKTKKYLLSWKSYLLDGLLINMQKWRLAMFPKIFALEANEQTLKNRGILLQIKKLYLDTREYIMDTLTVKIKAIKAWWQGLEIMNYIRENIIKQINLWITQQQIVVGNIENLHLMNKNSLKVFELGTTISLIGAYVQQVFWQGVKNVQDSISNTISRIKTWYQSLEIMNYIRENILKQINLWITGQQIALGNIENMHLTNKNSLKVFELGTTISLIVAYVQEVFWQGVKIAQDFISTKLKAINVMWTKLLSGELWKNTFARITGNSVGVVENIQMKENIFLRMWKSTETIRGTIAQGYNNVVHFLGNTLLLNGWILLTQTIPTKIYDTLVIGFNSLAKWWNTNATGANTLAKLGNLAVTVLAAVATVIMVAGMVIATVATWAWNVSLYANPIGLIVLGVIAAVAVLVIFAIKINEQIDLWFHFKLMVFGFFGMIKWGLMLFVNFFKSIGDGVYSIMEGPLFKLGLWFSHLFKMLIYYVKLVGGMVMTKFITPLVDGLKWAFGLIKQYLIDPILGLFGKFKDVIEGLRNPLFTLKDMVVTYFINPIKRGVDAIKAMLNIGKKLKTGVVKKVKAAIGLAEGGYISGMANGGNVGTTPYMVGEKGPEIFRPSGPGKIIPNKDLNTQRVYKMLKMAFGGDLKGGKGEKMLVIDNLEVNNLSTKRFDAGKAALAIDSFAGKAISKHRKRLGGLF